MLRKKKKLRSERNSAPPIVILRELSDDELSGVVSGAAELLTPSYSLLFTMLLHTSGGSAPGKPKTALIIHLKYVEGQPANGVLLKNADFEYVLCLRSDLQPEVDDAIQAEATQIIKAQANNPNFKARYWHDPSQASSEEAPDILTESFTDTVDSAIISPPMPPKEVVPGDHIIDIVTELQSQAKLGSERKERPRHYPHENVVDHVAHLRAESLEKQPDRLVTIKEGVRLTGLPHGTIGRWLSARRLKERGRQWLARPGGRSIPMYSLADLTYLKDNPPPVGKHINKEKPKSKRGIAFEGRPARERQEEQVAESSEHLVTLSEASQASGITLGTLYNYINTGKLTVRGREPYPAPGGGKVLVDPAEVRSLPRRPRGRPKKNKDS